MSASRQPHRKPHTHSGATTATGAATRRLKAAHQVEYDQYVDEERAKQGLPPMVTSMVVDALKGRIAELEQQLAEKEQT